MYDLRRIEIERTVRGDWAWRVRVLRDGTVWTVAAGMTSDLNVAFSEARRCSEIE